MTGDRGKFLMLKKDRSGDVAFRDNGTAKILGKGTVAFTKNAKAQNVLYVEGLKHDLLSVGQLCDADCNVIFFAHHCEIRRNGSKQIIGRGIRSAGSVYVLEEVEGERCLVSQHDNSWLWRKRLAHLTLITS